MSVTFLLRENKVCSMSETFAKVEEGGISSMMRQRWPMSKFYTYPEHCGGRGFWKSLLCLCSVGKSFIGFTELPQMRCSGLQMQHRYPLAKFAFLTIMTCTR